MSLLRETVSYRLIPLYSDRLMIVVTDDVTRSRMSRSHLFGEMPSDGEGCTGMCAYFGFRFGLFFERSNLCHDLIAHEVYHLTHRVLERHGIQFGVQNHEPFSHLCGYLTGLVYAELARMKEPVKLKYSARKYQKREPRLRFSPAIPE